MGYDTTNTLACQPSHTCVTIENGNINYAIFQFTGTGLEGYFIPFKNKIIHNIDQ